MSRGETAHDGRDPDTRNKGRFFSGDIFCHLIRSSRPIELPGVARFPPCVALNQLFGALWVLHESCDHLLIVLPHPICRTLSCLLSSVCPFSPLCALHTITDR